MCCRYWNMRATSSFGILKRQPWFWSRYVEKSFSVMPLRFWGGRREIEFLPCELLAFFPFISILGLLRGLVQTLCIEFMSTLCPDIQEQHSLGYVPRPPRPKLDVIAADHVQSWSCAAKLNLSAPMLVDQINLPVPTASKSRVRRPQTSAVEREKSERDKVFLFWRFALAVEVGLRRPRWLKLDIPMFKWRFRGPSRPSFARQCTPTAQSSSRPFHKMSHPLCRLVHAMPPWRISKPQQGARQPSPRRNGRLDPRV